MLDKDLLAGVWEQIDWRAPAIAFAVSMILFLVLEFAL